MTHIFQEQIDELAAIAERGFIALEQGDYKKAKSLARKLEKTHFVSEGEYFRTILLSETYLREGDYQKAKELVLFNIGYCWGDERAFAVLSSANPSVSETTKLFVLKGTGGTAVMGVFSVMSDTHYAQFEVLAETEQEAFEYLRDFGVFHEKEKLKIKTLEVRLELPEDAVNRGVYTASPFDG